MRIAILSQYFYPETGAPQNRLYYLGKYLANQGHEVLAITAMPNYPNGLIHENYRNKFFYKESFDNITIYRSWLYATKTKKIIPRLINYFTFVITSLILGIKIRGKFDLIICESPPLFLGITALILKKIKRAKLLFNVSDLWPKGAVELGIIKNSIIIHLTKSLEEFIYNHSDIISGQTNGIIDDIGSRIKNKNIHWYPNGYDFKNKFNYDQITMNNKINSNIKKDSFSIFYAGILGLAQNLQTVLKAMYLLRKENIELIIAGTGPDKNFLNQMKIELKLDKVIFLGHMSRAEVLKILSKIDVGIVPLADIPVFLGAIPSKIFEILAFKKPILLGVKGEAKRLFIKEAKAGYSYYPDDEYDLVKKIRLMKSNSNETKIMGKNGFHYVKNNFNQDKIVFELNRFIIENI